MMEASYVKGVVRRGLSEFTGRGQKEGKSEANRIRMYSIQVGGERTIRPVRGLGTRVCFLDGLAIKSGAYEHLFLPDR